MKKILLLSIIFCSIHVSSAQTLSQSAIMLDSLLSIKKNPGFDVLTARLEAIKRQSILDRDTITRAKSLLYLSSFYSRMSDYANLSRTIGESNDFIIDTSVVSISDYISAQNNAAALEKLRGNHKRANELLLDVLELEKEHKNRPKKLSTYYQNLAHNYLTIGDFKGSASAINQGINYANLAEDFDFGLAESLIVKGDISHRMGDLDEAKESLDKGLELLGKPSKKSERKLKQYINANHTLARIFYDKNQFVEAKGILDNVRTIQKLLEYRIYKTEEISGLISIKEHKYSTGIDKLTVAIAEVKEKYKSSREYPVLARLYKELGDAYMLNANIDSSLVAYQNGLKYFDLKLDMQIRNNPDISKIIATTQALELLHAKAKVSFNMYRESFKEEEFAVSLSTYKSLVQLIDKMKQDFLTESSKFFVAEQAYPIYQEAIDIIAQQYQKSGDPALLEDLFALMEKNKSSILFQGVKRKYDLLSSSLPEDLLVAETELSSKISFFSKLISEEKINPEMDSARLIALENELFEANEKYILHQKTLENEYQDYFNYKDAVNFTASISDVQQKLSAREASIEYFVSLNTMYFMTILKDDVQFRSLPLSEVQSDIERYQVLISRKPEHNQDRQELTGISQKLGSKLMDQSFLREKNALIIVSDGLLGQIPFESFLMAETNAYVVEEFSISYYYSIRQYLFEEQAHRTNDQILCLAPQFSAATAETRSCDGNELGILPFAAEEAAFISSAFDSKVIISDETSTSDLINNIENFGIIHLATHACINAQDPMLSEIHFNDGVLTNYEIQDLNVRPDLVVLSACNTAQGQIKKGEGMVSLTRGFFEAGIKSLQSSLWSIDDFTSSQIVKGMYTNLKRGQKKSIALQNAKLEYLASADKLRKHPYYWAAMVQIGDDSPMFSTFGGKWIWVFTGVLTIGLLLFYFTRRNRS